jgi:hypothetical protein
MRPRPPPEPSASRARPSHLLIGIGALVGLLLAVAGTARAAEPSRDLDRWVPSFAFFFDVTRHKADGSVQSGSVLGPPLDPFDAAQDAVAPGTGCLITAPVPARSGFLCPTVNPSGPIIDLADASSDTSIAPLVGGSLELMTPRLLHGFLDPRLFARGEAALAFGFERNLAGFGDVKEFSVPLFPGTATDLQEFSIPGQGSRSRLQIGDYVFSAGGGIALTVGLFERTFRIKPSVEWIQLEYDFIGVTHRAIKLNVPSCGGLCSASSNLLDAFREISLSRVKTRTFDGLGAGLELEVDTARLGPVQTSLYVMGRAYRLVGDVDNTLTATNEFGETATWTAELERWMYRAGVGFRFRWSPETD